MSIALLSLIALLIAIAISCFAPFNIGLLCIAFSFIVGSIGDIAAKAIIKGFPINLFMILAGVTYLFGIAQVNGTLERLAKWCIRLVRGNAGMVPIIFAILGYILSAIGPGAIPVTALLAPPAMVLASKMKINPFLMALMVVNGCNASSMSPITPTGAVAYGIITDLGMGEIMMNLFRNTTIANFLIAGIAYILFGGLKLWKRDRGAALESATVETEKVTYERQHILTLIGIGVLLIGILVLKLDVGLLAITIGVALTLLRCADEGAVIKSMPWFVILMVCGVTVLIGLMSSTGGLDMATNMIASISTPQTVIPIATFIPGIISAYSSTTGVVLPAFLPMIPGIADAVGSNPAALISGVCLGSLLVDASPLSTLGALAIGAATAEMDKNKLFRNLLIWGLSMSVVGAFVAWLLFGVIRLAG